MKRVSLGRKSSSPGATTAGLLLVVVAAMGCGDEPAAQGGSLPGFPAEAFQLLTSAQARFNVAVRAAPQPPVRGIDTVQYQVTDQSGAPVLGLVMTVVPWMPAHAHGTSVHPTVIDQGGGVYEARNVVLFMEGRWELRTALAGGDTQDSVVPAFDVH